MAESKKTDTIKVGTFGDYQNNGREVPKSMVGKIIWYSPSRDLFVITDIDNNGKSQFGFEKYKQFVDTGVIVYTNQGIQNYMEKILREKTDEAIEGEDVNGDGFFDGYDTGHGSDYDNFEMPDDYYAGSLAYDNDYEEDFSDYDPDYQAAPPVRRGNRRDASIAADGGAEVNAPKVKDPTRHIAGFFITTLVLAIIAFILLNFAQPIIELVSPLLS